MAQEPLIIGGRGECPFSQEVSQFEACLTLGTNQPPGSIRFMVGNAVDDVPAIELMPDGRFLVQGREAGTDRAIFEAFQKFITYMG